MKQKSGAHRTGTLKGALLVLGAVAVGGASGVGLDYALPQNEHGLLTKLSKQRAEAKAEVAIAEAEEEANASTGMALEPAPNEIVASESAELTDVTVEEAAEIAATEPEPEQTEESVSEPVTDEVAETEPAANPEVTEAFVTETPRRPTRPPAPPAADVLRPWWLAGNNDAFAVQYVGQVAGQTSMAILFSRDMSDPSALEETIKVLDKDGKVVTGKWTAGKDARLLVRPDLRPGRYTLVIDRSLASADGKQLQVALRGPVYIR